MIIKGILSQLGTSRDVSSSISATTIRQYATIEIGEYRVKNLRVSDDMDAKLRQSVGKPIEISMVNNRFNPKYLMALKTADGRIYRPIKPYVMESFFGHLIKGGVIGAIISPIDWSGMTSVIVALVIALVLSRRTSKAKKALGKGNIKTI